MSIKNSATHNVDEALWDAYRRYDKTAVMERLIFRYLPALTFATRARTATGRELTDARRIGFDPRYKGFSL
jgi:hypothetical protein